MPHTSGPWHRNIKPASKYNIVFAGRNTHVAAIQAPQDLSADEIEANCDLVTAAPELLAALKLCLLEIAQTHNRKLTLNEHVAIDAARSAIDKAEGL